MNIGFTKLVGAAAAAVCLCLAVGAAPAGAAAVPPGAAAPYAPTPAGVRTVTLPAHISPALLDTPARQAAAAEQARIIKPMASCAWYDVAETDQTASNLRMTVSVWGQYTSAGAYCGEASDHDCAVPSNSSYQGFDGVGLIIWNWWFENGTYVTTTRSVFTPSAGQEVCSYSGGFWASQSALANGEYVNDASSVIGTIGAEAVF